MVGTSFRPFQLEWKPGTCGYGVQCRNRFAQFGQPGNWETKQRRKRTPQFFCESSCDLGILRCDHRVNARVARMQRGQSTECEGQELERTPGRSWGT